MYAYTVEQKNESCSSPMPPPPLPPIEVEPNSSNTVLDAFEDAERQHRILNIEWQSKSTTTHKVFNRLLRSSSQWASQPANQLTSHSKSALYWTWWIYGHTVLQCAKSARRCAFIVGPLCALHAPLIQRWNSIDCLSCWRRNFDPSEMLRCR